MRALYKLILLSGQERGGLFEINETFCLFREIEIKMQRPLLTVSTSGQRQLIVASDDDVQFLWALISCDVHQEEQAIILLKDLWLTIHGFLVGGTWLEQHKKKSKTNSCKSIGLRRRKEQHSRINSQLQQLCTMCHAFVQCHFSVINVVLNL